MGRIAVHLLLFGVVFVAAGAVDAPAFPAASDTATTSRADLEIVIDAPSEVPPGRLVKLVASADNATAFRWTLAGGSRELYDVAESGRVCYFSTATPGTYVFVIACARCSEVPGDPPALSIAEVVVTVTGTVPPPPPPPPPPPTPVLPDGKYKLAQFCYELAKVLPATDKPLIKGIASNYAAVASMAAAGVMADPPAMLATTKERNASTVGMNRERLLAPLFQPMGVRMAELSRSGELKTLADHITAWQEIAAGMSLAGGK
jgi:hypothetical protein